MVEATASGDLRLASQALSFTTTNSFAAPPNVVADRTGTSEVTLGWDPSDGSATSYTVVRYTSFEGAPETSATVVSGWIAGNQDPNNNNTTNTATVAVAWLAVRGGWHCPG